MADGLSIIIVSRNEQLCEFTCRRLRETVSMQHEIIVVDDGSTLHKPSPDWCDKLLQIEAPVGNSHGRHQGLSMAEHDTCLILDAHMNFHDDDWAEEGVMWSRANPDDMCCTVYRQIYEHDTRMDQRHGWYWGAHIDARAEDRHGRRRLFPGKWNTGKYGEFRDALGYVCHDDGYWHRDNQGTPQEIGCILGGAYFLQRDRYFRIGAPWQYHKGWGTSEQLLSLPNWLQGGRSLILPIEIGHCYRDTVAPYRSKVWHMLHNQLLLAFWALNKEDFQSALKYVHGHQGLHQREEERALTSITPAMVADIRGASVRTWEDYCKAWEVER